MRIRDAQLQVFQELAEDSLVTSVMEYLREEHSDVTVKLPDVSMLLKEVPGELLEELVRNAIAVAHGYGMSWQSSLAAFVTLSFTVAPNFHRHHYISQVLEDGSINPDLRIDELWERTTERTWREAVESYDPAAWAADLDISHPSLRPVLVKVV